MKSPAVLGALGGLDGVKRKGVLLELCKGVMLGMHGLPNTGHEVDKADLSSDE